MKWSIWIGYEPRETDAYLVASSSILNQWRDAPIRPLILDQLRQQGLYFRSYDNRNGQLYDEISCAPMSTQFAISRFLTPILAETGWALFMDCDMLVRTDLRELFVLAQADPTKAVVCVKHDYSPRRSVKMDDQIQSRYSRKNWSSVMMFNCDHPANRGLTVELVNTVPGRDLHNFCWLKDDEIGELDREWNYLVGESDVVPDDPKIVHFTNGIPTIPGYEQSEFSDEWRGVLWECLERRSSILVDSRG